MRLKNALIPALCSWLLAACGGDSSPVAVATPSASATVEKVNLSAASQTVRPGWEVDVSLEVVDSNGVRSRAVGPVQWASSDPGIATVASPTTFSGSSVRGLALGRATITATVAGVRGTTEIDVRRDAPYSFARVSAGEKHTCATGKVGPPACWGSNAQGQLGNGTARDSAIPVEVLGIPAADAVAAGAGFSCVASAGKIHCWGQNAFGQLGDGTTSDRWAPSASFPVLADESNRASLSAGSRHACAVADDGYFKEASCWGDNSSGQFGNGTTTNGVSSMLIVNAVFDTISAGAQHTCGVWRGKAYCWGGNEAGQLGDGSYETRLIPSLAAREIVVHRIATGLRHTCAVSTSSKAYCWGDGSDGQLGNGSKSGSADPVAVAAELKFRQIAAGHAHTCGLTVDGIAYCWGSNSDGQLGDGTTTDSSKPVAVAGELRFESIAAGGWHGCGLTADLVAYCWGSNSDGQLGNGTLSDSSVPVRVLQPS